MLLKKNCARGQKRHLIHGGQLVQDMPVSPVPTGQSFTCATTPMLPLMPLLKTTALLLSSRRLSEAGLKAEKSVDISFRKPRSVICDDASNCSLWFTNA